MKLQVQIRSSTEVGDQWFHIFYMTGPAVVLLPGLIVGLVSSWHSNMIKTFLRHPSIFVLPMFTPFTFTSSRKTCCVKESEDAGHIRFSVRASLCNLFASFSTSVIYVLSVLHQTHPDKNMTIGIVVLFIPFTGSLLSLLFLCNARPTTNRFNCCCCSCCSCEAAIEYGIYKPDSPTEHFILRINADGSEEICADNEEEEEEETEAEESMEMEQGEQQQGEQRLFFRETFPQSVSQSVRYVG